MDSRDRLIRARFRAFLRTMADLPAAFLRDPRTSAWLLDRLPFARRGYDFAREWQVSPARRTEERRETAPNALEAFFDLRISGRGITKWRHYFDVYDRHLSKFVGREVRILEVGVFSGGSLEMWRHYLGARCFVLGVDIQAECRAYESEWARIIIGDQADRQFWRRMKSEIEPVDIVIDDGGHAVEQQIVTLEEMLPSLRPGGVYICEDTHGDFDRFVAFAQGLIASLHAFRPAPEDIEFLEAGHGIASHPTPFQKGVHSIHSYPFLTVIERNDRPVERFVAPKHGTDWQPFTA
jgi:SAM-dependent methyltransferase